MIFARIDDLVMSAQRIVARAEIGIFPGNVESATSHADL
jgi:hypothetical protein